MPMYQIWAFFGCGGTKVTFQLLNRGHVHKLKSTDPKLGGRPLLFVVLERVILRNHVGLLNVCNVLITTETTAVVGPLLFQLRRPTGMNMWW